MRSILLVDDSRLMRLANGQLLTKAGYAVTMASDGEEALAMASAKVPDLILLDMMLPKISGPEVLQELKKNPLTAHVPVIVLTGLSEKNRTKLKQAGATDFIEKSKLEDDSSNTLLCVIRKAFQSV